MINTAQAILTIYPSASPIDDFRVDIRNGVETIRWINVAPLTKQQIDNAKATVSDSQYAAAKQVIKDAVNPDLATMRDQAAQGIADINTFLAIASPTNQQLAAEAKAIDLRMRVMIKAVLVLANKALS